MTRVEGKIFYCPKCHKRLVSKDWAAPMCPNKCGKQMRRDRTGREGVFVKQ
jgi:hypothetical protein